jgi:hypothetical protein
MKNSIRYKKVDGRKKPLCDYIEIFDNYVGSLSKISNRSFPKKSNMNKGKIHNGNCNNLAFKEVYPDLGKKNKDSGWCYLCRKHFKQEQKRFKGKLVYCGID